MPFFNKNQKENDESTGPKAVAKKVLNSNKLYPVAILFAVYFFIWAILFHSIFGIVFAVLELIISIAALLIHKGVIRLPFGKQFFAIFLAICSLALIIPYVRYFDAAKPYQQSDQIVWEDITLSDAIPTPNLSWGEVNENTDSTLQLTLVKISKSKYNKYMNSCIKMGYTMNGDIEDPETGAYNPDGYQLTLIYSAEEQELTINLTAPPTLQEIAFPAGEYADQIPQPSFTKGYVEQDDTTGITVYVNTESKADFGNYMTQCMEYGFTNVIDKSDLYFYGKNEAGYELTLQYFGFNAMSISVQQPEYNVTINIEYKYSMSLFRNNINFYIDDTLIDTLGTEIDGSYSQILTRGIHTFRFENAKSTENAQELQLDIGQPQTLYFELQRHFGGTITAEQTTGESWQSADSGSTDSNNSDSDASDSGASDSGDLDHSDSSDTDTDAKDSDNASVSESGASDTPVTYERAFQCAGSQGVDYIMFDTDHKTVVFFSSVGTDKKTGTYVGEFSSGLVISWDKAAVDQTDQFTYQEGTASATLKAHDGTISTFTISDVQEDTAILNSLNTGE